MCVREEGSEERDRERRQSDASIPQRKTPRPYLSTRDSRVRAGFIENKSLPLSALVCHVSGCLFHPDKHNDCNSKGLGVGGEDGENEGVGRETAASGQLLSNKHKHNTRKGL